MGLNNLNELNVQLNNFKNNSLTNIKKLLMKEFKNFVYKTKFNQLPDNPKSYLTKAFCDFLMFNYLNIFLKSSFNEANYNLISDYLELSNKKIQDKSFKDVLIITASKVSKFDKNISDFVEEITEKHKLNVKIRNLEWYNMNFFQDKVVHSQEIDKTENHLRDFFLQFDQNLFDQLTENKFKSVKLDFEDMWKTFFERNIIASFEKFIFTPIQFDQDFVEKTYKKLQESIQPNTLVIFLNNVEINSLYKTAFLNNIELFANIIKNDCPVITIGDYNELNLIQILSSYNLKSTYDILSLFETKNIIENNRIEDATNTLNKYWDDILDSKTLDENLDDVFKNQTQENFDLLQTVTLKEPIDFEELQEKQKFKLFVHFAKFFNDYNNEDKNELIVKFKEWKKDFESFIKIFEKGLVNLKLKSQNIDQTRVKTFKEKINLKTISELHEFIKTRFDQFESQIRSSFIDLQDLVNFYNLYIKVKSSINEIEFALTNI
ncbi:hypothetical protein [Spiroplasma culicicola]|uniref:Uncharacterized protein n=1 Tax=Spiroplasma culicicola AES-1 TaxID=1276246 RepID=W6A7E4_9MOLU|nr:hypothetical protein [Spiroplasma culicicola]AHI52907.1 hypothetical protein SCULI_v1c05660 [Spiroplasma culicicola AES-1]